MTSRESWLRVFLFIFFDCTHFDISVEFKHLHIQSRRFAHDGIYIIDVHAGAAVTGPGGNED